MTCSDGKILLTWDEILEAFEGYHVLSGSQIDTLDDFCRMVTPVVGDNYCYQEDILREGGDPYIFDGVEYNPVFEDPDIFTVEQEGDNYFIYNYDFGVIQYYDR